MSTLLLKIYVSHRWHRASEYTYGSHGGFKADEAISLFKGFYESGNPKGKHTSLWVLPSCKRFIVVRFICWLIVSSSSFCTVKSCAGQVIITTVYLSLWMSYLAPDHLRHRRLAPTRIADEPTAWSPCWSSSCLFSSFSYLPGWK